MVICAILETLRTVSSTTRLKSPCFFLWYSCSPAYSSSIRAFASSSPMSPFIWASMIREASTSRVPAFQESIMELVPPAEKSAAFKESSSVRLMPSFRKISQRPVATSLVCTMFLVSRKSLKSRSAIEAATGSSTSTSGYSSFKVFGVNGFPCKKSRFRCPSYASVASRSSSALSKSACGLSPNFFPTS